MNAKHSNMLEGRCPRAVAILEKAKPNALACLDFPPSHWKRPRTNNVQERTNREIKRRSRVVQAFPSTASLMRLPGAVMSEQDEAWQESMYFFGGKDEQALRRGSHVRDRRDGRLGAAGGGGQEDNRIGPRAYGQDRGDIRFQPCSKF